MIPRRMFLLLLAIAIVLGFLIAWVDSRPTWDDTGITAIAVLAVTGMLSLIMPKRAWLWALAVGGWIPLAGIIIYKNYGSLLGLAVASIGAFAGATARKGIAAVLTHERPGWR